MRVLLRMLPALALVVLAGSFWLWERATPPADAAPPAQAGAPAPHDRWSPSPW